MEQSTLRELAREALGAGTLPNRRPDWLWGGPARGAGCSLCRRTISVGETAFEAEFRDPVRPEAAPIAHSFHVRCFGVWDLERDSPAEPAKLPGRGSAPGMILHRSADGGTIPGRELDGRREEESA